MSLNAELKSVCCSKLSSPLNTARISSITTFKVLNLLRVFSILVVIVFVPSSLNSSSSVKYSKSIFNVDILASKSTKESVHLFLKSINSSDIFVSNS